MNFLGSKFPRAFCLAVALATVCAGALAQAAVEAAGERQLGGELYSESQFSSTRGLYSTLVRARFLAIPASVISPFLLLQEEGIKLGSPSAPWENGSFHAVGAGVRMRLGAHAVFTQELRLRSLPESELDTKGVLAEFERADFSMLADPKWFTEHYAEAVYLSSDQSNLIVAAYGRLGRTLSKWRGGSLDAHAELLAGGDRLARFYNNRVELKPGFRFSQDLGSFAPIQLSLFASYTWQSWIDRGSVPEGQRELRPGPRFLLTVGGEF